MAFSHLPNELTLLIAAHLDIHSINALHQTNHHLHTLLTPLLHDLAVTMPHSGNISILTWAAFNYYKSLVRILLQKGFCVNTAVLEIMSAPPDEWDDAIPMLSIHGGMVAKFYDCRICESIGPVSGRRKTWIWSWLPRVEVALPGERPACTCATAGTADAPCPYWPRGTRRV
ncbi:uncharacterized protein H6S33_009990 [Morchella sextelata]|uniref:uncharacterized protein n=1 Tax=Morchella sextelata TaxID=1174677 RepID=UPI001D04FE9F|nr:uncharacterized protein H6S33_009990 [Morchella sextelata]KAH0611938.1 hypothetical protein H6S33_009990 [Morchella sextelata]